ncbi:ketopantoate reductase family protein [bacterium LRH843]|nr:ketopantoate reductase family protein [bacterium LRH843]
MNILIVGAGAVGGYFGARLIEKGEDVTFLVRKTRREQLEKDGLVVESIHGNVTVQPKVVEAGDGGQFDVILIGTKSYHLDQAIESVKPFAHEKSVIIPMLNGIAHIGRLQDAFSHEQVIGGVCFIESTVTPEGVIKQTSPFHHFTFGELNGESTERIRRIAESFSNTKAVFKESDKVLEELWHKYLFITTLSGVTTLFQQPAGPIRELPEGIEIVKGLIKEITTIMRAEQAQIAENVEELQYERFAAQGYHMKSSMLRDMEKGLAVESDHIQGYLLVKARKHEIETPILKIIYANLKLYENR